MCLRQPELIVGKKNNPIKTSPLNAQNNAAKSMLNSTQDAVSERARRSFDAEGHSNYNLSSSMGSRGKATAPGRGLKAQVQLILA